jgi:hypothetical protein
MAINFPDSPTLNQQFTAAGRTWIWDGSTWANVGTDIVVADVTDLTASAAEINILDGALLSTTELNYVDGVTSAIQTQINGKAATVHTHIISDVTSLQTSLDGKVDEVNGAVTTASTSSTVVRNITLSTGDPTGGMDGDVWLKYTA